jgi:TRAP-type C4-dicarboxylate transport system permease small subunit
MFEDAASAGPAEAFNMTTAKKGQPVEALRSIYGQAMDALYLACVLVAGTALVLISAVIPWAVYTRYVLNQAASWPEPMAVLLTIVLTFFGAAACYRRRLHMNVSFFVAMLPPLLRQIADLIAELLVALFALFMVIWGVKLVDATWYNTIADFPALSVGVTYLPIPLGGAILLLFVIERVSGGARQPAPPGGHGHAMGD